MVQHTTKIHKNLPCKTVHKLATAVAHTSLKHGWTDQAGAVKAHSKGGTVTKAGTKHCHVPQGGALKVQKLAKQRQTEQLNMSCNHPRPPRTACGL